MKQHSIHFYELVIIFLLSSFSFPKQIHAQAISGISPQATSVPVYDKFEVRFTVSTSSQYPFFQYDTAPPPGVTPKIGITVEGIFTSPSGKILRQPAFYTTEVVRSGSGTAIHYDETNKKYWVLRFAPQETGTYSYSIFAQDANGSVTVPGGTFTATTPTKNGYIKVSTQDPRYFEFSNGTIYWPIGPAWVDNGDSIYGVQDYTRYKDTGQNLERVWMAGIGAYSGNFARWISSAERLGNEGIMNVFSWTEHFTGRDLSYYLYYPQGFRYWLTPWTNSKLSQRIKPNTSYQIKIRFKTTNIAGPRVAGYPYGFVIKAHDFLSHETPLVDTENTLRNAPRIIPHQTTNQDWHELTTTFTSPSSVGSDISLFLDNVSSGQVYIDEFSMKEILSDGTLGGEQIRNPIADIHTYVDPRGAAYFDWQVSEGEKNGVFFKYVVHDKNDWIQNSLTSAGQFVGYNNGNGYYQEENTKARWLLRQWYRYIIARWGYSTAVHSWELNNEGPPNEDPPGSGTSPHWRTAQAFGKFMHENDAHRHLVTTSFWCCFRPAFWKNSTSFPDIDYADLHEYAGGSSEFLDPSIRYDMANFITSVGNYILPSNIGKPLLMGETGITDPTTFSAIADLTTTNPGIYYHNLLWGQLHPGAPFAPNYWWSQHLTKIDRMAISKPFYDFVQTLDLNKGGYSDAVATVSNTKIRAIGQKNLVKGKAVLWIQNKDHTWKNVMNSVSSSQTGTISITMGSGTYTVAWYNTYTGALMNTETKTGPTITLTVNGLTDDRAVKISSTSIPPTTSPSNTPTTPPPVPTNTPVSVSCDANGDGSVNETDYNIWIAHYGANTQNGTSAGDFNHDGTVNGVDYVLWLATTSLTTIVPTPTSTPTSFITPIITPRPTISITPSSTPYTTPIVQTTEWTQYAHDAQHTAYSPDTLGNTWSLKWIWNGTQTESSHIYYSFDVQPITGGGNVYIGTMNYGPAEKQNRLIAISQSTGQEVWNYQADSPILHTAAYNNGSVYFSSQNGTVYKVSSSGQLQARRTLNGQIYAAPLIANGKLYIGTTNNFYALNLSDLSDAWSPKNFGAEIRATAGYSQLNNYVIVEAQNMHVYALNADTGNTVWDSYVGGQNRVSFQYLYPVISDITNSVIIRTDVTSGSYACYLMPDLILSTTIDGLRQQLGGTKFETFFVLNLTTGTKKYVAPVAYAAEEQNFGTGCYGRIPPPPPALRRISATEEVAYLAWRIGSVGNDYRSDSALGEMDLLTGNIRFVQLNENNNRANGNIRLPSDEISMLSMSKDVIFHMGWQAAGAVRVTDRSPSYGASYNTAIPVSKLYAILRSLREGTNCSNHYCSAYLGAPLDSCSDTGGYMYEGPGFYVYTSPCTQAMLPPESMGYERNTHVVISNGVIYSKGRDGAITAISTN